MSNSEHRRTTASTLLGASIEDASGAAFGRVQEFAVVPGEDTNHIHGLVVRRRSARRSAPRSLVPVASLIHTPDGRLQLSAGSVPGEMSAENDFLLIERDLLDQQIIDVHGHKVVRVNDVDLTWEIPGDETTALELRICEVEVGPRGAVRRLLKGLPQTAIDNLARRFKATGIPWEFVDLIERDPARRVKLKVEGDRLSQMHPSDIADILEELPPAERHALFISLDEEVAAEALEEVRPKTQQALIESLGSERVAGIVEEMDPGAAADLLSELSDERSEAILGEMDPEDRRDVEDLLEFSGDSAAGRMTTDFVALEHEATVEAAITALRDFDGDTEIITDVYLLDGEQHVCGLIPVVRLLFADREELLQKLPQGHIVSCDIGASGGKVAELFDKYNLRSLPVLDESKRLVGVIHAEQVIALLRTRR